MKKAIEIKITQISAQMHNMESEDPMAFQTEKWKILQAQREVLAEIMKSA